MVLVAALEVRGWGLGVTRYAWRSVRTKPSAVILRTLRPYDRERAGEHESARARKSARIGALTVTGTCPLASRGNVVVMGVPAGVMSSNVW